jgi:hypothetical protein
MHAADRKAIKRGAVIAGITGLGLAAEILLTNVVFASKVDHDGVAVVLSYLCVFAMLFVTGMLAGRDGARRSGQLLAGLTAGVLVGALTIAAFIVVNNVWLDVVAQQQTKLDGFARSGAGSMRDYINHSLIGAGVFFTVGFGALGAVLGGLGGFAGSPRPGVQLTP